MKSPIYPLFQISSFVVLKREGIPLHIYFFFFDNFGSGTKDCFLIGPSTNDCFCAHGDPNEIVQVELGSPIFLHSLADTFLSVIYPPLSLENTRFPFQATI